MLNVKIKSLRKEHNLTQEELAEKLMVSRQAITKWESGLGTPDISNLEALANLFGVTIDELLSEDPSTGRDNVSRTEFDLFGNKDFHFDVGTANTLEVTLSEGEKMRVEIRSDIETPAYQLAKVRFEDGRDVDVKIVKTHSTRKTADGKTKDTFTKQDDKMHLFVKIMLPESLAGLIELEGEIQKLIIHDFEEEKHVEFDGKANFASIQKMRGHLELTSNADMEIVYDGSLHQLDINQIKCVSNLIMPKDAKVDAYSRGRGCAVVFSGYDNVPGAENKVEFNGYKSELTIRAE